MSIQESIARQNALLDYPAVNRPSLHVRFWETTDAFQEMYNRLANSNESFAQDEKQFTVSPNNDIFNLPVSGFGKVVLVTTYSTEASHIERSIDFVNIKDIKFNNWQPDNYEGFFQGFSSTNHSAEKMAFFYDKSGTLKVRVSPKPKKAATYKIRFSVGDWATNADMNSSPILTQFKRLFEVRSALGWLPYCEWDGLDKDSRREKITELKESLMNKEKRYEADFERYIKSIAVPKIVMRKAWNEF